MGRDGNDFHNRLVSMFRVQAIEHLETISAGLIELESAPTAEDRATIVETIFREAHSLKGDARTVNMTEVEAVCQALESIFAAMKRGKLSPSAAELDLLHGTVDTLRRIISAPSEKETARIVELIDQLALLEAGQSDRRVGGVPPEPAGDAPKAEAYSSSLASEAAAPSETVRISASRLDDLLRQTEEMLSVKLASSQRAADLRDVLNQLDPWEKNWARVQPQMRALQRLLDGPNGQLPAEVDAKQLRAQIADLLEFHEWAQEHVKTLEGMMGTLVKSADQDRRSTSRMVDALLEDVKQAAMLPFSTILGALPRFVRQLSREHGKDVELMIRGGETEIDRRILEELRDPLIHLVRNCLDHGIETPEERVRQGKPPQGTITVAISRVNSSKVEILVSDDGAGLDPAQVREAAVKRGIVSETEASELDPRQTASLVFESGLSTSSLITDISGRGLGLAIVREKVDKLNGLVAVETDPREGTSFRLHLPLTLATFRGILIRAANRTFVVPTTNVERVLRAGLNEIKTVENRDTIVLNERTLPLVLLADILELPRRGNRDPGTEFVPVLVLGSAGERIALGVDEILQEQEVLVKGLGRHLSRVRNIAGATILGSGDVVPILNVPDLLKSAVRISAAPVRASVIADTVETKKQSILVVEDSIIARMLLRNILESAGFDVKIAVNGEEALRNLRAGGVDLVVSDVEMPRMNGFDLTAAIRRDEKLAHTPVVLVTAMESQEDRVRGVDAGADAYLVKSSFDQSNLLEVIGRLT